ncbi:MAG TPA: hypothetical protein VFA48_06105 [Gammaproteobacteria bacterium]|nr:hypothetical protein [Gammaproteobacteria bacterium]
MFFHCIGLRVGSQPLDDGLSRLIESRIVHGRECLAVGYWSVISLARVPIVARDEGEIIVFSHSPRDQNAGARTAASVVVTLSLFVLGASAVLGWPVYWAIRGEFARIALYALVLIPLWVAFVKVAPGERRRTSH